MGGINNAGDIVGSYEEYSGIRHGILLRNGVFTIIDYPGSSYTDINDINNSGVIVGMYKDANGTPHGFVAMPNQNQPQAIAPIGNQQGFENTLISFTVTASDPDSSNSVTLQASNLPPGATFTTTSGNPAYGTFSWIPGFEQAGNYQNVIFSATDNDPTTPLSVSQSITITVNNVNRPPVLALIGNKAVAEGQLLEFTVSATDPDGDPLVFEAANLPAGATFDQQTRVFSWMPTYSQAGQYNDIVFSVRDVPVDPSQTEVDLETISITVGNVNRAPVFTPIGSQSTCEGKTLEFTVLATDPDGDAVTYSTGPLPEGATFDPLARMFQWSPNLNQSGVYTATFYASDNQAVPLVGQIDVSIAVCDVLTPCERVDAIVKAFTQMTLKKPLRMRMSPIPRRCASS